MLRSRLKVASVFSRNRIGVLLRDLDVEFEMRMKKKIGTDTLVFRAEKKNIFHHGQSTTVRFLPMDLPPLSTISSISFVVLLPLFLPKDYAQKAPPPINAPICPSSSSSSSPSRLTQRACIARLNESELKPSEKYPNVLDASPSSSSAAESIVYRILPNSQPFVDGEASDESNLLAFRNVSSTLLAFWRGVPEKRSKPEDSLAFVSVNLHHHRLLPTCLQSTMRGIHSTTLSSSVISGISLDPHKAYADDVDPKFGLHGFDCIVELRHQKKSLWYHMFQGIFCRDEIKASSEVIPLSLIRATHKGDSVILPEAVNFPWKTELFVGKIPNLGILDLSLRDEFQKVIFEVSSPIQFTPLVTDTEGYFLDMDVTSGGSGISGGGGDSSFGDAESTKVWRGVYSGDPRGQVVMDICNNYEFGENRTKVVNLEIRLRKSFHNAWFGTKY